MKQLNKLSNPNKIKLYTYLCQLEMDLKGSFGKFDIKDPKFNNFLEQEKLLLGSLTEKNEQKKEIINISYSVIFENLINSRMLQVTIMHFYI